MSSTAALAVRLKARAGNLSIDVELSSVVGTLVIVGPNGAGKSSVLELVLGARSPEQGRITLGTDVLLDTQQAIDVPLERRRISYVPQDYALFPHLNVRENLAFAMQSAPWQVEPMSRTERLDELTRELGLEAYLNRHPQTLSGGEQQRVALARALSVHPRALLLDEPIAALDVDSRNRVRSFLADYLRKLALPKLVVTHDATDARELGDRIAILEAGQITQIGTWDDLARDPRSRFVEAFVASADRA